MTNADVSEINLGDMLYKSCFAHSLFESEGTQIIFTSEPKRYNNIINDCRVNMSHERYKLLCHKITCVRCTLLFTATERSLYADDLLDDYLFKLIAGRESGVLGERG